MALREQDEHGRLRPESGDEEDDDAPNVQILGAGGVSDRPQKRPAKGKALTKEELEEIELVYEGSSPGPDLLSYRDMGIVMNKWARTTNSILLNVGAAAIVVLFVCTVCVLLAYMRGVWP
jgi:hypothetical protein